MKRKLSILHYVQIRLRVNPKKITNKRKYVLQIENLNVNYYTWHKR